jgi:hypothetical protein
MTDLARLFSSSASSISSLAVSPSLAPTSCLSTGNNLIIFRISLTDIFFCGLECVCHSLAYVAYFVFLRDFCIRRQRAAVASRCATNFATHLPYLAHPSPYLATYLPAGVYILENTLPPGGGGGGDKYGLMGKKYHENNAHADKKEKKKERTREKKR